MNIFSDTRYSFKIVDMWITIVDNMWSKGDNCEYQNYQCWKVERKVFKNGYRRIL